jgi:hypothetical protein
LTFSIKREKSRIPMYFSFFAWRLSTPVNTGQPIIRKEAVSWLELERGT